MAGSDEPLGCKDSGAGPGHLVGFLGGVRTTSGQKSRTVALGLNMADRHVLFGTQFSVRLLRN